MRYPLVIAAPDGRRITCHDGEHAAAVHLLSDRLVWERTGAFVADDGDIGWNPLLDHIGRLSTGQRLLVQAAEDLYCGPGASPATLKRLCHHLDTEHLRRVLEAVCLLRPDAAPPGGWGR
jgi:hypothetical protein